MKNKYAGQCAYCKQEVSKGDGFYEMGRTVCSETVRDRRHANARWSFVRNRNRRRKICVTLVSVIVVVVLVTPIIGWRLVRFASSATAQGRHDESS